MIFPMHELVSPSVSSSWMTTCAQTNVPQDEASFLILILTSRAAASLTQQSTHTIGQTSDHKQNIDSRWRCVKNKWYLAKPHTNGDNIAVSIPLVQYLHMFAVFICQSLSWLYHRSSDGGCRHQGTDICPISHLVQQSRKPKKRPLSSDRGMIYQSHRHTVHYIHNNTNMFSMNSKIKQNGTLNQMLFRGSYLNQISNFLNLTQDCVF